MQSRATRLMLQRRSMPVRLRPPGALAALLLCWHIITLFPASHCFQHQSSTDASPSFQLLVVTHATTIPHHTAAVLLMTPPSFFRYPTCISRQSYQRYFHPIRSPGQHQNPFSSTSLPPAPNGRFKDRFYLQTKKLVTFASPKGLLTKCRVI